MPLLLPIRKRARPAQTPARQADAAPAEQSGRVLHLNLGILKYDTDDKTHAAAVVFSLLLFVAFISFSLFALRSQDTGWLRETVNWIGAAFLFVLGVAIGRGHSTSER